MRNCLFCLMFLPYTIWIMSPVPTEVTAEVKVEVIAEVTAEESPDEAVSLADEQGDWMNALGQAFMKEIQTMKQPIDEAIIHIGFSICEHVQKWLGMSYEQMKGDRAPNLNSLSLHYRTKYSTTIMNISTAPEVLQHIRQIDKDQRLIIFLHGFTDDPTKEGFSSLSRAFFVSNHLSVLALDASPLIRWQYHRSSAYVRFIGQKLGQVLAAIVQHGQDPSHIHIIGNSLGGHIAGFAGKTFFALTGRLIGRITGLDPAGPCFSRVNSDLRLKRTDAVYVDVIHTDAGVFGIKDPVGHKDYYPNGGSMQPGCLRMGCSHSRTWQLFGESVVRPHAFPALRCDDWDAFKRGQCDTDISYMGYASRADGRNGTYFLQTGESHPYGLGIEGIKFEDNDGILESIGNLFG